MGCLCHFVRSVDEWKRLKHKEIEAQKDSEATIVNDVRSGTNVPDGGSIDVIALCAPQRIRWSRKSRAYIASE
ncbi:hypothetical protein GCM10011385_02180 [Nitratireductor aestuarii]|uniref:Uncharacterized protein n=1 Tax=Nitratireductor aestuarii TaxID=1735103 RepID=A0A916RDA7_9HYPH|nr:hypothetical protein GCM10011385_02180 [Nitratireductor aestuarii]